MIVREPETFASDTYDLLIIGGGIHGVATALEMALAGLRPLLIEGEDFGGATSWNHQRVLHGGFRYLQKGSLGRYFRSLSSRRWFMRHFPELVRPLPCMMPLYGKGLRRAAVFRAGLPLNDLLSATRNRGVPREIRLPRGRLLSPERVRDASPFIPEDGLQGGAVWHDAVVTSSRRIMLEMLRWASGAGARSVNYVEAVRLSVRDGRVRGLECIDRLTGSELHFRAPVVVNCAGPWSRDLARRFDTDVPELFHPVLGYLVYLDIEPPADIALAVEPPGPDATTYFLFPWQGGVLAGTGWTPWRDVGTPPEPGRRRIEELISSLSAALPGWGLGLQHVRRVHAGFVPARAPGSVQTREHDIVHDHGAAGGPKGLYSVSGVKFTTAPLLAGRIRSMLGARKPRDAPIRRLRPIPNLSLREFQDLAVENPHRAHAHLQRIIREESVVYSEDLLLRRVDWLQDGSNAPEAIRLIAELGLANLLPGGSARPSDLAQQSFQDQRAT